MTLFFFWIFVVHLFFCFRGVGQKEERGGESGGGFVGMEEGKEREWGLSFLVACRLEMVTEQQRSRERGVGRDQTRRG